MELGDMGTGNRRCKFAQFVKLVVTGESFPHILVFKKEQVCLQSVAKNQDVFWSFYQLVLVRV